MIEKKSFFGTGLYVKIALASAVIVLFLAIFPVRAWATPGDSSKNPATSQETIEEALDDPSIAIIYLDGTIYLEDKIEVRRKVSFVGTGPDDTVLVSVAGSWHLEVYGGIPVSFSNIAFRGPEEPIDSNQNGGIRAADLNSVLSFNTCLLTGTVDFTYYNGGISSYGTVYMDSCTLTGNISRYGDGGAVSGSVVNLTNCTLSNNVAASQGGAVYGTQEVTLNQCTLSGNVVGLRDPLGGTQQGGAVCTGGTLTMNGTIIAGNYAIDGTLNEVFADGLLYNGGDNPGTVQDGVYGSANIVGIPLESIDGTSFLSTIMTAGMSRIITTEYDRPMGVLDSNGGPTQTILITAGGAADDKIPNPAPFSLPLYDQRGVDRLQGLAADVGAVELKKIITIDLGSSQSMFVGDTLTLNPIISPVDAEGNHVLLWASSDPTIATVDSSGVVTALKQGTVTITATAQDGSGVVGTVQVIVSVAPTPSDGGKGTAPLANTGDGNAKEVDNIAALLILSLGILTLLAKRRSHKSESRL